MNNIQLKNIPVVRKGTTFPWTNDNGVVVHIVYNETELVKKWRVNVANGLSNLYVKGDDLLRNVLKKKRVKRFIVKSKKPVIDVQAQAEAVKLKVQAEKAEADLAVLKAENQRKDLMFIEMQKEIAAMKALVASREVGKAVETVEEVAEVEEVTTRNVPTTSGAKDLMELNSISLLDVLGRFPNVAKITATHIKKMIENE